MKNKYLSTKIFILFLLSNNVAMSMEHNPLKKKLNNLNSSLQVLKYKLVTLQNKLHLFKNRLAIKDSKPLHIKVDTIINRIKLIQQIKVSKERKEPRKERLLPGLTQMESFLKPKDDESQNFDYEAAIRKILTEMYPQKTPADVNHYIDISKQILAKEKEFSNWYVFYHAYTGEIGLLFDIYSELYKWLNLNNNANSMMLRLFDRGFEKYPNIQAFLDNYPYFNINEPDHDPEFINHALSVNFCIFGGKDKDGERSFDYFILGWSQSNIITIDVITKLFDSFNFDKKYIELLEKCYKDHLSKAEGHMLQIFVHPDDVNEIAYVSLPFGIPARSLSLPIIDFLNGYRTNTVKRQYTYDNTRDQALMPLHPVLWDHIVCDYQARMLLCPALWEKVKIIRYYSRTDINDTNYKKELSQIVENMIKDWIQRRFRDQQNEIIWQNLSQNPPLQKLLDYVISFGVDDTPEKTKTKGIELTFKAAITNNNLQELKRLSEKNSSLVTQKLEGIEPLTLATQYGHLDIIKWLLENGADYQINTISYGKNPLMWLLESKTDNDLNKELLDMCMLMLNKGANIKVLEAKTTARIIKLIKLGLIQKDLNFIERVIDKIQAEQINPEELDENLLSCIIQAKQSAKAELCKKTIGLLTEKCKFDLDKQRVKLNNYDKSTLNFLVKSSSL